MNVGTALTKRGELAHITTLAALVSYYQENRAALWAGQERSDGHHDPLVDFCRELDNLPSVIRRATSGRRRDGKMFSEDSCIKDAARQLFTQRLLAHASEVDAAADFDALYDLVHSHAPKGCGSLMVYNVTSRIGGYLGLAPKNHVYVHAGPLQGWKALTGRRGNVYRVAIRDLPDALTVLPPWLVEDFLCEFREFLHPGLIG